MARLRPASVIIASLFLFALLATPASAIVYSLRTGYTVRGIKQMLKTKKALTEPVTYNGHETTLQVDVSEMDFTDIMVLLRGVLKDFKNATGQRSLIIDIPEDGKITRLFIFNAGLGSKTVIFQLQIPKRRLPKDASRFWPGNIPKPNGTIDQVIQLKKSKPFYGKFNIGNRDASEVFRGYRTQLIADGWRKISKNDVGGVYMDATSSRMLVVAAYDGRDKTHASVYVTHTKSGR